MPDKTFGARYGLKPRKKFAQIKMLQNTKHPCPYCNKPSLKRLAAGIWQCRKCHAHFAGQAYSP